MRLKDSLALLLAIVALTSCNQSGFYKVQVDETTSAASQFEFHESRVPVNSVYHFQISDRQRTYKKEVWLYVADPNHIEAFKLYPGASTTTLVIAELNWDTFSIEAIEQTETSEDLSREITLEMHAIGRNRYLMDGAEIPIGHYPVTNHGFDFSDLNFVIRHMVDPRTDVEIGVVSPILYGVGIPLRAELAYTGKLLLRYDGEDTYQGHDVYRYQLGGEGISNSDGYLLVNQEYGHFEYMEMGVNYHPDFDFFRYELIGTDVMDADEWEAFMEGVTLDFFSRNLPQ